MRHVKIKTSVLFVKVYFSLKILLLCFYDRDRIFFPFSVKSKN